MDIRPYRPSDFAACRRLWVELTEHHRTIYDAPGIGGDDPGADWGEHLARVGPDNLWVAVDDADAVAGLTGLIDEPGTVELEPLIVAHTRRGRGVARLLVERVVAEAGDRGHRSLSVRPVARNETALAALSALGFTAVGRVELLRDLDGRPPPWVPGAEVRGVQFDV